MPVLTVKNYPSNKPIFWFWSLPSNANHTFYKDNTLNNCYPILRPFADLYNTPTEYATATANLVSTYLVSYKNTPYSLYFQNVGRYTQQNTYSLMAYSSDAVTGTNGIDAVFNANGISANLAFMNTYISNLKATLDTDGSRYPTVIHGDYEPVNCSLCNYVGPQGWLSTALSDGRTATQLIDGVKTLQTYWGEFTGAGGSIDNAHYWFQDQNKPASKWFIDMYAQAVDYACYTAILEPAKAAFNVLVSNYGIYPAIPAAPVYLLSSHTWIYNANIDTIYSDVAAIPLYPPYSSGDLTQWQTFFNVDTPQKAFLAHAKNNLSAIVRAAALSNKKVVPWMPYVNWDNTSNGTNYTVTYDDVLDLIKYGIDLGITEFILWHDYNNQYSLDDTEASLYVDLVKAATAYYTSKQKIIKNKVPSIKYILTSAETTIFSIAESFNFNKTFTDWEFKKGTTLYSFRIMNSGQVIHKNNVLFVYRADLNTIELKLDHTADWSFRCREGSGAWTNWITLE